MPHPVYLAGAAMTSFGKNAMSLVEMLAQAARGAMDQAGVSRVDAVYLGVMNAEEFTGEGNLAVALNDHMDLKGAASSRVETASSTGAGALESAFFAVASGYRRQVLVVAGEKMTHLTTSATTRILSEVIAPTERAYGASMPALAALIARAYAHHWGLAEDVLKDALGRVAVKNHERGALNPLAQLRRPISLEAHHKAAPVAEPLGLFDCAPITDGAAAILLSSQGGPVRLAGMGHATDSAEVGRRGSLVSFNSTRQAAMQAYAMAQVNPEEVDLAEVHDAFTIFEIIGSEDLGFFAQGQGWRAALEGLSREDGPLPINLSGGLKARGHPVGASGLAQVVEAFWQMTGEVDGERRPPSRPRVALTQSIGGLGNNNLVTILVQSSRPLLPEKPWRQTFAPTIHPLAPARPRPLPEKVSGRLLAHTILHRPPEGFPSPLCLGMVQMKAGWRTLAHLDPETPPQPGDRLSLKLAEGFYKADRVMDPGRPFRTAARAGREAIKRGLTKVGRGKAKQE